MVLALATFSDRGEQIIIVANRPDVLTYFRNQVESNDENNRALTMVEGDRSRESLIAVAINDSY